MRAVLQRVLEARVEVDGRPVAEVGPGLLVFLGIGQNDSEGTCRALSSKVARLRVFDDAEGKMNRSLIDTNGSCLVVSQFTLYADTSRGLRPSFTRAGDPARARELYERFASELGHIGVRTRTGQFGARMKVALVNDGPVTIILEEGSVDPIRASMLDTAGGSPIREGSGVQGSEGQDTGTSEPGNPGTISAP